MKKEIILTGDRPTGKLHLGHYVGSLRERVKLQEDGNYKDLLIMIADMQALTDNASNPQKIRNSILELALDYFSCGIDPSKTTVFIQSQVPELCELTFYYMNLVTVARLMRNPTVKSEIQMRNFEKSIPSGFLNYPVSQAADITAFKATCVPVGEDQIPMLEQTNEIVRKFNALYGEVLVEPKVLLSKNKFCLRLPGTDGKAKMSKSLGNCVYLSDSKEILKEKVMNMFTDPGHIKVSDPGKVEGNTVFTYLRAFCEDDHFSMFLPDYKNLCEMEEHYKKGGLGDIKVKKFLFEVLDYTLAPIRKKRQEFSKNPEKIYEILQEGSKKARILAQRTLNDVRHAIGLDYF